MEVGIFFREQWMDFIKHAIGLYYLHKTCLHISWSYQTFTDRLKRNELRPFWTDHWSLHRSVSQLYGTFDFINAILFYKNTVGRLTSACRKQETRAPTDSISLLLYNLLMMNVTGRHSMSFAKRQAYFFDRKLGLRLLFFRKTTGSLTFETRLSETDLALQ